MGLNIDLDLAKRLTTTVGGAIGGTSTNGVRSVSSATEAKVASPTAGSAYADRVAQSADKGVNKMSKAETRVVLTQMIANEKDPVKRKALEDSLAKLDEQEQNKAASLAAQPEQAQKSNGCGSSGCSGGNKSGGCCGANSTNSVGQNKKVDKQSAMANLYIAEKNLQAAGGSQDNSNPFGSVGSNNIKEKAQEAYENAKAIAQQAGVTEEEYAAYKQQLEQK